MRDNNINTGLLRLRGEWRWADWRPCLRETHAAFLNIKIGRLLAALAGVFGGFGSILLLCLHTFSVKTTSWQCFPSETSLVNQHVNIFPGLAGKKCGVLARCHCGFSGALVSAFISAVDGHTT